MSREALDLAERSAVVDAYASFVRHDLRNKLAAIRNATYYLQRRVAKTELWQSDTRVEPFFKLIDDAVIGANRLIDPETLPALGRRLEQTLATSLIEKAVACARCTADARDLCLIESSDAGAFGDPDELAAALRCLVENALEAAPAEGDRITVRVTASDGTTSIEVADGGPGIVADQTEKVFGPFFTTKPGHLGLGLKIARRLAARNRGSLDIVGSTRGGCIVLRVPSVATRAEPTEGKVP